MILMPSDLSYIFFFWKIQLKKRPDRPPEAPAVLSQDSSFLSQHSSFLSQAQLSLIPAQLFLISSTALSYPKHSSFLSRHSSHLSQHSSFLSRHSSFLSHAQLFHIQCIRIVLLNPQLNPTPGQNDHTTLTHRHLLTRSFSKVFRHTCKLLYMGPSKTGVKVIGSRV